MNEPSNILGLSSVWLLWLICAAQVAFAIRALLIERREGMRLSLRRVGLVAATLALATVLAVAVSWHRTDQKTATKVEAPTTAPVTVDPRTKELQAQIDKITTDITQLENERKAKREEMSRLQEKPKGLHVPPIPPPSVDTSIVLITLLVIAGFIVLLVAGDLQTLLPERWRASRGGAKSKAEASEKMTRFTTAVWREEYAEGLSIAAEINQKWLSDADRRDYLFLRAYCTVQRRVTPAQGTAGTEEVRPLADAIKELENLLEDAPKRGDAVYLLGLAHGMAGNYADALAAFERAEQLLSSYELPFAHNRSVCLLALGESSLGSRDTAQAENYFEQVLKIGTLRDSVVDARVSIELTDLRKALVEQNFGAVSGSVERLQELKNFREDLSKQLDVITNAFIVLLALRNNEIDRALKETEALLQKHLPPGLPKADDEAAEEVLASPITDEQLGSLPRQVYREFLFMRAVALARACARQGKMPSNAQIDDISQPLLRGLQFDPRQPDLLAALGGLYYWFRRDQRQKALEWLQAAAVMGASGRLVHIILEQDRLVEMERRELLDWFRSASYRFLKDPTLASGVRKALIEELGRFQEFEPLLIDLDQKLEMQSEEPTLQLIKDRATYLAQLVSEVSGRGESEQRSRLQAIQAEYVGCLAGLQQTTERITELEGRVFGELGDLLSFRKNAEAPYGNT